MAALVDTPLMERGSTCEEGNSEETSTTEENARAILILIGSIQMEIKGREFALFVYHLISDLPF